MAHYCRNNKKTSEAVNLEPLGIYDVRIDASVRLRRILGDDVQKG